MFCRVSFWAVWDFADSPRCTVAVTNFGKSGEVYSGGGAARRTMVVLGRTSIESWLDDAEHA
jgi:hypothetical protein